MYNENLSYDKNGNIMNLSRYGDRDEQYLPIQIDNLGYTYATNSNKLMSVVDNSNNTSGFKDGNTTGDDYVYDANGNMTVDKNKNITGIVYNHLNLPTKIIFPTGNIVYIYTASGQKMQKIVTDGSNTTTTDYLGGYQYKNTVLQFFPTAEGYVKNTSVSGTNSYSYVFNYTDHLGNTRLSYTKDTATGSLKILDESNYYPFGLKHNGYNPISPVPENRRLYNGKELQDELGLDMYDYGARMYDPILGKYFVVDSYSDMMPNINPYRYAFNNPVKYIDPDGNFELDAATIQKYPRLARYLQCCIQNITSDSRIMAGFSKFGQMSTNDVAKYLEWGKGPKIVPKAMSEKNGQFKPGIGSNILEINEKILNQLETALGSSSNENLLLVISTILHEFTHYGDDQDGVDYPGEEGQLFEEFVWGIDIDFVEDARKVIEQYKEEQKENNNKKKEGAKNLISNFGNLEEGTYTWNGTEWVKQ